MSGKVRRSQEVFEMRNRHALAQETMRSAGQSEKRGTEKAGGTCERGGYDFKNREPVPSGELRSNLGRGVKTKKVWPSGAREYAK